MITPEQLNEVQQAYRNAVQSVNTPVEIFWDTQENANIVREYLLKQQGIPTQSWKSDFVWRVAILDCRSQGLLVEPPPAKTPEELAAERNAALRADGSAVGNAHSHRNPARCTADEKQQAKSWLHEMLNPDDVLKNGRAQKASQAAAAAQEQKDLLAALPLDVDFPEMTREQKSQFKRLNGDSVKYWLKRRADWVRQNPPVNTDAA